MNIEGAEYEVLNKVIKDGNEKIIDLLIIEFHKRKMNRKAFTEKIEDYSNIINKNFKNRMIHLNNYEDSLYSYRKANAIS